MCLATGTLLANTHVEIRWTQLQSFKETFTRPVFKLKTIPSKVLFIGGGYISMEFAHVVARCNIQTTIVERNSTVLAGFDANLVELLVEYSKRQGIDFRLNREIFSIHPQSDGSLQVTLDNGDTIDAGLVVHGFALAMKHGLTATEMKSTLFAFPTFASDVRQML